MPKIVKLNYDRKVRYIFDKDTEECERLSEFAMDHYGKFLETPHGWYTDDIKRFQKELRTCGLSVNEFLAKDYPQPQKSVTKPKKKVRKSVVSAGEDKPVVKKKKSPVKKKTVVKRKGAVTTVKKKPPVKKKPKKKVA